MTSREKAIYGLLLLLVWGVFAWCGKTETSGFINALGAVLMGLGLYHMSRTPPPPPPPPVPLPPGAPASSTSTSAPPLPA